MATSGKKFGGYDGPPKTVAEAMQRAGEMDQRRQQQIANQTAIINRLLAENQLMYDALTNLAGMLSPPEPMDYAQDVLNQVEEQRKKLREKEKK